MVVSLHIACRQMDLQVKPPASASELRQLLVSELQRAPESYHLIQARTLRRELELMKHDGQLLCVEALEAFAYLFSCIVLVHYEPSFPVVYSSPFCEWKNTHSRVHLQCLCGIHYNPAAELSGYIVPRLMSSAQEVESHPVAETIISVGDAPGDEMNIAGIFYAPTSEWCSRHPRTHAASLMIKCRGLFWCALLDTGAEINCMSQLVCAELGVTELLTSQYTINGIGPHRCQVLGMIQLAVTIGNCEITQSFAVVEDTAIAFCFILGIDCLDNVGVQFNFVAGQLVVGDFSSPLSVGTYGLTRNCSAVSLGDCCDLSNSVRNINIGSRVKMQTSG